MGSTPWDRLNLHMKEALNAFLECLSNTYHLAVTLLSTGSLRITVQFQTLKDLELLWSDYQSRTLDEKAGKYLMTDDIKNKLNVKAVALKTEILQQDYLACKHFLVAISGECYGGEIRDTKNLNFSRNTVSLQVFAWLTWRATKSFAAGWRYAECWLVDLLKHEHICCNLQRNNVARQGEGFCISYFAAFSDYKVVYVQLWHRCYM